MKNWLSIKKAVLLLVLGFGLIQISCSSGNPEILSISHGKSFGMCEGYCFTEETYTSSTLILHQRSNKIQPHDKFDTLTLSDDQWKNLMASVDMEEFKKLPKIIGCPDCADGGAEWITIKTKNEIYKVTFDYNSTIKGLEKLLQLVRPNGNTNK